MDTLVAARMATHAVRVGNVAIGGGAPVVVQSMTNVRMVEGNAGPVLDCEGNLAQISALAQAGCEIARVAIPNLDSIEPFSHICEKSVLPVVADIHFNPLIAMGAIKAGADAIRINPGNIGGTDSTDAVIDCAGEAGIPIRIGVNGGSLDPRWSAMQGMTLPEKLSGSVSEYVEHFNTRGFRDIVVSAKLHDVASCVECYRLLSRDIPTVPLHLGVTEAGTFLQGVVKSAVGIGSLLLDGIGDTLRVSLTDDPVKEVEAAWSILEASGIRRRSPELISCPTCSRCQVDMIPIAREVERRLKDIPLPLRVAVMGCVVNGPGEAKDADIGVACGKDCGILFEHGDKVAKTSASHIVDELFSRIDELVSENSTGEAGFSADKG